MLREKLLRQIDDIRDETMFKALHYKGHALYKHVLSDEDLRRAIREKHRPIDADDIVMVTRFFDEDSARNLIADTLEANIKEIEAWLLSDVYNDYVAVASFDEVTGDGLVKNADWTNLIPVHGVTVVIRKDYSSICNSFSVVTGYPFGVLDDVDDIYDAIDAYLARKDV